MKPVPTQATSRERACPELVEGAPRHTSLFACHADEIFHLAQIFFQSFASGGGEAIFGARHASFKKFVAGDVASLFQLAGMHAEVAVGGLEQALEVVEAERIVDGQRAHDAQPQSLMDDAIELGQLGGGVRTLRALSAPGNMRGRCGPLGEKSGSTHRVSSQSINQR